MKNAKIMIAVLFLFVLFTGCKKTDRRYVKKETPKIMETVQKAREADKFRATFFGGLCGDEPVKINPDINPFPRQPEYYLVTDFDSIDKIKEKAGEYYTQAAAGYYFFDYVEDERIYGEYPYLIEAGGKVYCNLYGLNADIPDYYYDTETAQIIQSGGEFLSCQVKTEYIIAGNPGNRKECLLCLEKVGDKWLFSKVPLLSDSQSTFIFTGGYYYNA